MNEQTVAEIFAENLKKGRRKLGLTQKRLGELIGYSEKSVSKWESGEAVAPSTLLPILADQLHTTIDSLLTRSGEPTYYLGIDGGGTKCEFVLCDREGHRVARTVLGPCNPVDIGIDAALKVLEEGIKTVCDGIPPSFVSVFAGLAGGISGDNKERVARFLEGYRFAEYNNGSDAENAVAAALGDSDGIAVIAGTGSIAFVKNGDQLIRTGGYGYLLEEGGSGFSIGQGAIRAALMFEEGSAEETLLYPAVLEKCGHSSVLSAIAELHRGGKTAIASFAPLAFQAADKGDAAAIAILEYNAGCIARLIESAGRKTSGDKVTVAIVGGLTARADILLPMIEKRLSEREKYEISVYSRPPVEGALRLAGLRG